MSDGEPLNNTPVPPPVPPFRIELDAMGNCTLKLDASTTQGVMMALDGYVALRALAAHVSLAHRSVGYKERLLPYIVKLRNELRAAFNARETQEELKRDAGLLYRKYDAGGGAGDAGDPGDVDFTDFTHD